GAPPSPAVPARPVPSFLGSDPLSKRPPPQGPRGQAGSSDSHDSRQTSYRPTPRANFTIGRKFRRPVKERAASRPERGAVRGSPVWTRERRARARPLRHRETASQNNTAFPAFPLYTSVLSVVQCLLPSCLLCLSSAPLCALIGKESSSFSPLGVRLDFFERIKKAARASMPAPPSHEWCFAFASSAFPPRPPRSALRPRC
ncbi:hypothetical protein MNBD_PLANCTO03-400, partial [hydrothermal vent metagenome]